MEIITTRISGCYEIRPTVVRDERGTFVKTFHQDLFAGYGLATAFAEEYYSVSRFRVLRGLHFQVPPREHVKVVYCVKGRVLDAVVDLRRGSPTYGQYAAIEITGDAANMVYMTCGLAHGFYVLSEEAIVVYKVTSIHSPEHDTGIHWNSAGIPWPDRQPIVSLRDSGLVHFAEFQSPFRYESSQ